MCGIVGYTGPREAGPDPHGGPAPPRIPRLRLRRHRARRRPGRPVRREARGQAEQPPDGDRRADAARRARARAHPLGDPRPPERRQRPSPGGLHRADHGDPQRDHRELPGAPRRPRGARPHARLRDGHGGDRPPRSRRPTHGDIADAARAALRQLDGAYALAIMHRDENDRLVGARKDVPLVVGIGEGESFLASDVAAILGAHAPGHLPRGGRRRRPHARARGRSPTSTAGRWSGSPRRSSWTIEAAEKGGYDTSCSRRSTSSRRRCASR